MYQVVAQGAGVLGICFAVLLFQAKTRNKLLLLKFGSDVTWALHYVMLHAYSGFFINVVAIGREIAYLFEKNPKRRVLWLILFLALSWVLAYFKNEGPIGILPLIATTIATYSFWQKSLKRSRLFSLIVCTLMFTYDIVVSSYPGLLCETLVFTSTLIAIYRYRGVKEN